MVPQYKLWLVRTLSNLVNTSRAQIETEAQNSIKIVSMKIILNIFVIRERFILNVWSLWHSYTYVCFFNGNFCTYFKMVQKKYFRILFLKNWFQVTSHILVVHFGAVEWWLAVTFQGQICKFESLHPKCTNSYFIIMHENYTYYLISILFYYVQCAEAKMTSLNIIESVIFASAYCTRNYIRKVCYL